MYSGVAFAFSTYFSKYRFLFLNYFEVPCSTGKIIGPSVFFFFFLECICQFSELLLHLDSDQVNLVGQKHSFLRYLSEKTSHAGPIPMSEVMLKYNCLLF